MDKLAPKLIRRASKKNYIAIIIDPIYKVITGDENSADQMAHFCNQFDKVCTELGCAVIYCHHHSKGAQGGKRSMDRASGSGVFARDPDALIDLVELELNDDILKQEKNKAVCKVCEGWLYKYDKLYHASQDDLCSETQMLALCREYLENDAYEELAPLLGRINRQHLQIDEQMDELQRQQTEFSQITSSMREGLVLLDEKEHVLSINPAAEKLFGTDESCVGQDFLTIDRSHDMSLAIERAMDEGHSEARVERGGRIWQFDVSRIGASGAAVGAVLLAFDITERETAEQTRREFTANVSHELKTPLQGIIGSAELLENGMVQPDDVPRFVGHIRKEAQRLVTLIGDIIRLSQLDEGDEMPRETVDLLTLSQEAADDLTAAAEQKNVTISVTGESTCVSGVRRLLYEVIYNLCDNGVKYNVEGGSVSVRVGTEDGKAVVSVADTGIGIAPEHRERIFERFYRVDKSHSKASGGTGLGLSIVKHAVQYHHGTVELQSEEGKGTTIRILLPKE